MPALPLLTALLLPGLQQPPAPAAADCGRCHVAIHAEWQQSAHARAFTDPLYQGQLKTRRQPANCLPCHVPDAVLDRLGQPPQARQGGHEEGITCVSCHRRGDAVHGPFGAATAAHPSRQDAAFTDAGSTALCTSCHATAIADVLPLARDFAASSLPQKGRTCTGCHMPELRRPLAVDPQTGAPAGPVRGGRSHQLLGPGDDAFCAEAFGFRVERRGERLSMLISNGAGHRVPGLRRWRRFPVRFRLLDAAGRQLHALQIVVSSDNPLLVDEVRQVELPAAPGAAVVDVSVDHVFARETRTEILHRQLRLP